MDIIIAHFAGVDISKDMLDVHRHPDNLARRFANNSHKGWEDCMEPTGTAKFPPTHVVVINSYSVQS